MKRISLILAGLLLVNTLATAQLRNFEQRGGATHELRGDGLTAAHPNLAIGSKVMVVNTVTGKEIEVTITGRIPAAANRIVDLSPGAWQELGLNDDTPVRIYMPPVARPRPVVEAVPAALTEEIPDDGEPAEEPADEGPGEGDDGPGDDMLADAGGEEDVAAQISRYFPLNLTVNTYVTTAEETPRSSYNDSSNTEFLAWLTTMMMDARDARDSREARDLYDIRDARDVRDVRDARDVRDVREARDLYDLRDARDVRDLRDARDVRDLRDARDTPPPAEPVTVVLQLPETQPAPAPAPAAAQAEPAPQPVETPPVQVPAAVVQPSVQQPPPQEYVPQPAQLPPVQNTQPQPQSVTPEPARQVQPQPAPSGEIQIIPGLPDRFTGKYHDIQIGAFSAPEAAARTMQLARGAGFDVVQEMQGSIRRVIVTGIPAADVYPAIQRLAVLGFRQFWVRD